MTPMDVDSPSLVSIDPGVERSGFAWWWRGVLRHAEWAPAGSRVVPPPGVLGCPIVVIERPRARRPQDTPGGVAGYQALIDVALAGGLLAGLVGASKLLTVHPDEWKGSVPKDVCAARARALLLDSELRTIELPRAKTKAHNVWDAIGIGLFALGRCGRGVVRP